MSTIIYVNYIFFLFLLSCVYIVLNVTNTEKFSRVAVHVLFANFQGNGSQKVRKEINKLIVD